MQTPYQREKYAQFYFIVIGERSVKGVTPAGRATIIGNKSNILNYLHIVQTCYLAVSKCRF